MHQSHGVSVRRPVGWAIGDGCKMGRWVGSVDDGDFGGDGDVAG